MNENKFRKKIFLLLIVLLIILGFLIVYNFFIHQSFLELQNINKELLGKLEHFNIVQKNQIDDLKTIIDNDLNEILNNQEIKKKYMVPKRNEYVDLIVGVGLYIVLICYFVS